MFGDLGTLKCQLTADFHRDSIFPTASYEISENLQFEETLLIESNNTSIKVKFLIKEINARPNIF